MHLNQKKKYKSINYAFKSKEIIKINFHKYWIVYATSQITNYKNSSIMLVHIEYAKSQFKNVMIQNNPFYHNVMSHELCKEIHTNYGKNIYHGTQNFPIQT